MQVKRLEEATTGYGRLAEVWGDVVSRRQLAGAIVFVTICSVSLYEFASSLVAPLADVTSIGKASAMLIGVLGTVVGGGLCAVLTSPKRVLLDRSASAAAWQLEVLEALDLDKVPIGSLQDLPPDVANEMRASGLYGVFKQFEDTRSSGVKRLVE